MYKISKSIKISEFKNTAKISKLCSDTQEPILITKHGKADMVIMNANAFEKLITNLQISLIEQKIK